MTSWDALSPKLAPNPQQHKATPIILAAMVATAVGAALTSVSLRLLLGIAEVPTSFDASKDWRLVLDPLCLYVLCSMISHGNNLFGLSRRAGYLWWLSGMIAVLAVVRDFVIRVMDPAVTAAVVRDLPTLAVILGTLLAGVLGLRAGNVRFARARRYLVKVVRNPHDLRGLGYSLYLRTFDQDRGLSGAQPFSPVKRALRSLVVVEYPEELLLADALSSDDAPLVAVGRPGEPSPDLGALRFYLPHEDWKPQVHDLMEGARHVVLALGWGEGTLWELGEAMRILEPEQLILIVPMEQPEYERFRGETAGSLPARLPQYDGRGDLRSMVRGLVTFSAGWEATFVPVRAYSPFHNSVRMAVLFAAWPALRRLDYPPRGILRWAPDANWG